MERTLLVLALLAAVAAAAPRPTLHLLGGRLPGRHMGLLGHIINSTADVLLKPLSILGGGHHAGLPRPDSGHVGGINLPSGNPNPDANTHRPISEGIPLGGGHEQTGGGNNLIHGGGNSEENTGNGLNNGIGQTPGTTQSSVDIAIHDIFGSGSQSNTPSNTAGHISTEALGEPNTPGSGHEQSTPSSLDIAIQEIFGGNGGHLNVPLSNEGSNGFGSSKPANNKNEIFGGNPSSASSENGEHKQTTSNPVDAAIHDVFGSPDKDSNASKHTVGGKPHLPVLYEGNTGNSGFNSKPSSGIDVNNGGTSSPVDVAILEVFGRDQEAGQTVPNSQYLVVTP